MTCLVSFGRGVMAFTYGSLDTDEILLTTHIDVLSVIFVVAVYPVLSWPFRVEGNRGREAVLIGNEEGGLRK